ncbi:helix-turn-helix domain-containing protein [Brevibacterium luteolum]|uniref:AraC family transcriptional regulator n=1 Tax=Brevibacterium luteolum TaxID=199591 RepID=UPI001C24DB22|nr:helix-turn-helix domain-containing protein [Brevibacterium luteolum]
MACTDEFVVLPVPPELRQIVRRATGYRVTGLQPGIHLGMPSASLTLIIDFSDGLLASDPGAFDAPAHDIVSRSALLAGLHTRATRVHHNGQQHGIELDLNPLAARQLLGMPVRELAQGCHTLDDVWPCARSLRERLGDTDDWTLRARILFEALKDRIHVASDPVPREVAQVWRRVIDSQGQVHVEALAREVGWSTRFLQKQFRTLLGITPKEAARIVRFDRARQLVAAGAALADVAFTAGFADQPHLARDWRAVTGTSITSWLRNDQMATGL